jgi:protoporphyrinogen oxidase
MRIVIIGAGATGLAAAYDLSKAGHAVTVLEAGSEVGGLAAGFKDPSWDWSLEKFYHHWFETDRDVLGLIDEIGHGGKVVFPSPTTSLWTPEGIYPLDRPVAGSALLSRVVNVLGLTPLPLLDRLRFGVVGMAIKLYPNGLALEKYRADAWLERMVGQRAHELVWRPLLIGKFGPLYDQVNLAWFWARIVKRTAKLGTFEGGFQAFLETLAEIVRKQGAVIQLNAPVQRIEPMEGGGLRIQLEGEAVEADRVLSTTSPRVMARLTPALPESYRAQLEALKSLGALALILALDRQLMADGTYWLNLPAASPDKAANPFPFLALVEHTNYLSREHYGGDHLVYLGDYLPADHEHFRLSEEELAARFLPSLKRVNPDFSLEWIRKRWLFRAPYAQPVPFVNHSKSIPAIHTPVEGLFLACMSQVYPWDRGTNYAVEIGRRAARMMLDSHGA